MIDFKHFRHQVEHFIIHKLLVGGVNQSLPGLLLETIGVSSEKGRAVPNKFVVEVGVKFDAILLTVL